MIIAEIMGKHKPPRQDDAILQEECVRTRHETLDGQA